MLLSIRQPWAAQPQGRPSLTAEHLSDAVVCFHAPTKTDAVRSRPYIGSSVVHQIGSSGYELSYNETTDTFYYPNGSNSLSGATALTVSAVFKRTDPAKGFRVAGVFDGSNQFICDVQADGSIVFGIYQSNSGTHNVYIKSTRVGLIQAGVTYSIATSWTPGELKLSVNGVDETYSRDIWVSGSANYLQNTSGRNISIGYKGGEASGLINHVAIWKKAKNLRSLSLDPWQVYTPRIKLVPVYALLDPGLLGDTSSQDNTSSSSSVTSSHSVLGGTSSKIATASIGAITSSHSPLSLSSIQTQVSSSGGVQSSQITKGSSSSVTNQSTSGALSVVIGVVGLSITQSNSSTSGSIAMQSRTLGSNADQSSQSASGGVSTSHLISGSEAQLAHLAPSGAALQGQPVSGAHISQIGNTTSGGVSTEYAISGESVQTTHETTPGAITTQLVLASTGVAIDNISAASEVVQQHILSGSNAEVLSTCTSKKIYVYSGEYRLGEGRYLKYRGESRVFVIM